MNWPAIGITATLSIVAGLLIAQFFVIDHGSSGQLTIDSTLNSGLWATILAIILGIVGVALGIYLNTTAQRPYIWIFSIAFISFIISNFAVFLSLHQVQVSPRATA
jgi:uncharacterized membrane protein